MRRLLQILLSLLLLFGVYCCKKDYGTEYERPSTLAQPIYQQLETKGNFTSFLKLIDKAKYKSILGATGYFTIFAPNDAAFATFLTANNLSSIDAIDTVLAGKIVRYSLVYNKFDKSRLDDYQSKSGWVVDNAFKRRTAYYKWIYKDTLNGQVIKVMDAASSTSTTVENNNNKYIPYFTKAYFSAKNLTSYDYNYFFPNTNYCDTLFNVLGANVVTANIPAENGYIHEVDKVLLPPQNLYDYISANPQYSEFKKLLDNFKNYLVISSLQTRFQQVTGSSDPVYTKYFSSNLAFSPSGENFLEAEDNDAQKDGWSMFVPTNDALLSYLKDTLCEYYNNDPVTLYNSRPEVVADFINAHMWQTTVWPSKFSITSNFLSEPARFNAASDVVDKQVLSNGMFYGTSKVQQSDVFRSIFGVPYLNPAYSLWTKALNLSGLRYLITTPNVKYTMFVVNDQGVGNEGFYYSVPYTSWEYTGVLGAQASSAKDKLYRDLYLHVAVTFSGQLNDLSGEGIVETYNGEFIKYKNNQVFAAGNGDNSKPANVLGYKDMYNGRVYYIDRMLTYPENYIPIHLKKLAYASGSTFKYFCSYLLNCSDVYNSSTLNMVCIQNGANSTIFVPNNTAILKAISDGVLPALKDTATTDPVKKRMISKFVRYHIFPTVSVAANGDQKANGNVKTAYTLDDGTITYVSLDNENGSMIITDESSKVSNVLIPNSNNISNRCVIHLVDNYFHLLPNH